MSEKRKVYYVWRDQQLGNGMVLKWQKQPHDDGTDRYLGLVGQTDRDSIVVSQGNANKHRSREELIFEAGRSYEREYARAYIEETVAVVLEFDNIRDEVMGRLQHELQRHLTWSRVNDDPVMQAYAERLRANNAV